MPTAAWFRQSCTFAVLWLLLAACSLLQPCFLAVPLHLSVLGILIAWAFGARLLEICSRLATATLWLQAYVGCWLLASYGYQLLLRVEPSALEPWHASLGLRPIPSLSSYQTSVPSQPCSRAAGGECDLLA